MWQGRMRALGCQTSAVEGSPDPALSDQIESQAREQPPRREKRATKGGEHQKHRGAGVCAGVLLTVAR